MSDPAKPSKPDTDAPSSEEARMRHALGLREDGTYNRPPQRRDHEGRGRRFVKEGEVPVVMLNGARDAAASAPLPSNRVVAAEGALRTERVAHERAEHALREAQAGIERLETKLAHAEMAHAEALAAERRAREAAEQTLAEALAEREALETRLAGLEQRLHAAEAEPRRGRTPGTSPTRRVARQTAEQEPEPVKWWLPSYRAKTAKR